MQPLNSQTQSAAHQQPRHLWDYWGVVMKRWWLLVLTFGVAVAIAWLVTKNQEPQYRATATIEIVPPTSSGGDGMFAPAIFTDDRYLDTQVEKLRMPTTIERAVKAQKLSQLREFAGKSDGDIVKLAINKVEVSLRRNKLLMDVSLVGPDPRVLHHLANALVQEFREMQRSETRNRRETVRSDLEGRIAKLGTDIKIAEQEKRLRLEAQHYSEYTFDFVTQNETARLGEYTKKRDEVSRAVSEGRVLNEAFKAAREKAGGAVDALAQIPDVRQNPQVVAVQRQIDALGDRREQLIREGVGVSNERMRALDQEIDGLVKARMRAILDFVDGFQLSYRGKVEQLVDLERDLKGIEAKVQEVVQLHGFVDEKKVDITRATEERTTLNRRLEPILASQFEDRDIVSISQPAHEPTEPFSPNLKQNLILGAILGLLCGLALAFLLDYLDDTIRTKDELAKVADVPLLGVVPNIQGGTGDTSKKDMFAHAQPKSTISEAYRGVRTALTLSAEGPTQKVLLLTSAGPREGKTTTAINLATVLAYAGGRTLLIDADLRKPRVHKSFGVANTRGLTNLIIGHDDPVDYCMPTQVDKVDLLPSGPIPPNPSEMLGHKRMFEILARLREKYDHIIIDTPPIGAVTDAAVLATICDGVILVVHAGKTRRQIVQRGLEQLRYINAHVVGVILNNLQMGRIRYYPGYYHYYYYYSSHYGAEEAPPEQAVAPVAKDAATGDDAR
ncbi:MAG: polysaccharide biosynthesis tyrosine autokinase [Planctomycetes bacterium]|nr:polysaccharide biosynthesis tyrosine autokinase [Planctomycetota bacterium]